MTAVWKRCLDNRHEQCRGVTSSPDNGLTCSCACHDAADECADEHAAAHEADLRMYAVEL